eukprot:CAMPEP_0168471500 /NCGR_PEP_ID=MMETSP0228-20121227/59315_1 /TAXON_ID=133427 /ORGANISM="Protoceratium reticulatum, Strain CCCM 535 (=CCMP 1889)" /LENGTH=80 /DNA_ID=CAMNT_0008487413 /DNA_START=107 /DNA_END=347 /DNA_ORIENTATION=+
MCRQMQGQRDPQVPEAQRPPSAAVVEHGKGQVQQMDVYQERAEVELQETPPGLAAAGHQRVHQRDQHEPPDGRRHPGHDE